ncbi:MAG TPA: S9 family peptidase [Gammaproteobacteria bacterium]|nr:S9 family peptidase [Gammaproteobacteria bacterium]
MKKFFLLVITLFLYNSALAETSTHSSIDDVFSFKRIGSVIASPDGKKVVFTVMQVEDTKTGKKWQSSLYLKNENGKIQLLTPKNQHASLPVWSPDSKKLIYLVKEKNSQSVWQNYLTQSDSEKWFEFNEISAFKWSPDGKYIAFVGTDKKQKPEFSLINAAKDYVNSRIYLISSGSHKISPLTSDKISITQTFPGTLDSGFDFSPDGKSIVFAYQARAGADYSGQSKMAIINLSSHTATPIPYVDSANQPLYSSDGKWIAFSSHPADPAKLTNNSAVYGNICVIDTNNLTTHCLANSANENPLMLGWNKENNKILILEPAKSQGFQLYALDLDSRISTKQLSNLDGYLDPLTITLNQDHSILGFSFETIKEPPEAFISSVENFNLSPVSHVQTDILKNIGDVKTISWKSNDNLQIEGLLITPSDYDPRKKYPLLVMVHGGPAGVWPKRYLGGCEEYGESFVPDCFAPIMDEGFIIFQPNPRGSTGYGKNFRTANFKDFGGGDYRDVMSGVDYLIQKNIADPGRLAIFGWSYGGYLTAWAITQTSRFKAAIDGDGLTDLISFSGTTDIPFYLTQYLGGAFWSNSKLYFERSPISYVKNITTPLLILHGEKDDRVPLSQGQELYTALELQKKPVKMLIAPNTEHVPDDVNIIYEDIKEIQEWLKRV